MINPEDLIGKHVAYKMLQHKIGHGRVISTGLSGDTVLVEVSGEEKLATVSLVDIIKVYGNN
jgi:uncharacterized protein (UPF0218 family)